MVETTGTQGDDGATAGLEGTASTATREELFQLARRRGLHVTRRQTRASLLEVLSAGTAGEAHGPGAPDHGGDGEPPAASRVEAFTLLAQRRAAGEMVLLPRLLTGTERRIHVRQTIREDHQTRIATHDEEAREKFDKLAASPFSFFRGTALLFYRDMAGEDPWMPTVLSAGDVHPDNFGVVPNRDDVPVFGIDDYDEAAYAPFTWDLKRGATGFMVAAESEGGKGATRQRSTAEAFVRGYADAMRAYAADATEAFDEMRRDNAPPLIAALLDHAVRGSRAAYLTSRYLDAYARVCGRVLANLHARSDEAGRVDHDVEPEILAAMAPLDLFVEDVVDFAAEAADGVRTDHASYRRDHAHGAFCKVDRVYR
ncbi:MAG: DUF2252 family protein [Quadrisphaera sp.]